MNMLAPVAILVALCIPVDAGSIWNAADTAAPFAIRFNDSDVTGTITVTATNVVVTDDGNANSRVFADDATPTLGEVVAAINSATNSAGGKNFEAVLWAGIAADVVTNSYLIVRSAATITGEWDYGVKWDTSTAKHYDSAVGVLIGVSPTSAGKIDRIFGDPIGTGDVTLSVYVDGSVKWSRLIVSPVYTTPASTTIGGYTVPAVTNTIITFGGGTNAPATSVTNTIVSATYTVADSVNANVTDNSVAFDFRVNIEVGNQPAFVRAARATTATTGGIGISDTIR